MALSLVVWDTSSVTDMQDEMTEFERGAAAARRYHRAAAAPVQAG